MAEINLESFLRAYMDYAKAWPGMGAKRYKDFWQETLKYYLNGKDNADAFDYSLDGAPKSVLDVIEEMKRANGSSRVSEIKNTVNFVTEQVFGYVQETGLQYYNNNAQLQMFLKRLSEFNDKNLVYDALKFLKNIVGYRRADIKWLDEKRKIVCNEIVNMIASNPNATQEDIVELIYWAKTPDEVLKVINDVFAKTDEDLDVEMKKDVPSAQTVNNIIYYPKEVVSIALGNNDASLELKEYIDRFREQNIRFVKNQEDIKKFREFVAKVGAFRTVANDKYNFDRIVGSGDRNYVSNYEETVDNKNVELEKENQRLIGENQRLEQGKEDLRQDNEDLKAKNKDLKEQLANERAARHALEDLLKKAEEVIAAYEEGEKEIDKAGVFGKGTAKVNAKRKREEAEKALQEAKRKETERKQALAQRQREAGQAIEM